MPFLFEKYDSLIKHANGRPVGVRNGQGQAPVTASNPALSGMKHAVEGARDSLVGAMHPGVPTPAYAEQVKRESLARNAPTQFGSTLQKTQRAVMQKQSDKLKHQTSPDKAIETMTAWLDLLK